jgi:hypothetical protein
MKISAHFCFEKWPFAHFCLSFSEKIPIEKWAVARKSGQKPTLAE